MISFKSHAIALACAGSVGVFHASAHEIADRSLTFGEENYLCTYEGAARIDTGLDASVTLDNSTNIWLAGKAQYLYVVDRPGGAGMVPEGANEGEMRYYSTATRRLENHYPLYATRDNVVIAGHAFSDGPGGYSILISKEDLRFRKRQDFGGRTGSFISMDDFGSCISVSSEDALPQTVAMKEGLSGEEAEQFIDDWEKRIKQESAAEHEAILEKVRAAQAEES